MPRFWSLLKRKSELIWTVKMNVLLNRLYCYPIKPISYFKKQCWSNIIKIVFTNTPSRVDKDARDLHLATSTPSRVDKDARDSLLRWRKHAINKTFQRYKTIRRITIVNSSLFSKLSYFLTICLQKYAFCGRPFIMLNAENKIFEEIQVWN